MADEPRRRRDPPPLTAREARFCQLWVETGVAARSYIDAGFPHASRNAAAVAARRRLRRPAVREYIQALHRHAAETARTTLAEVVAAVRAIALGDRRALFDERGGLRPPHEWPADLAAAVARFETTELLEPDPGAKGKKRLKGYTRKVTFADRLAALVELAELAGLIPRKGEAAAPGRRNATVVEVALGPEVVDPPAGDGK